MFEDGVWRTIGGRRIFIKDGEDLSSAMKKSGKFKTTKEQKKAGVKAKESDFDKNIEDMDEEELKAHLNKLESGLDDFDEGEPQYKELQKEYKETKKALDAKSKGSESNVSKNVDDAKARMLELEGTLDDFENDDDLRGSKAHKDAIKEYNQAKAEYDRLSSSLNENKSDIDKDQHIKESFDKLYGMDKMDKVSREMFIENLKDFNRISKGDYESLKRTYGNSKNSTNFKTREQEMREAGIKFASSEQAKGLQSKANKVVENMSKSKSGSKTPYKAAYEEYMKKHPNSKLTFNKFVDMSEGK